MASLRLTFPEKDQPTVIALTGARLTIGRLPFNTIQIIDRTVSGFHAELISEHGHYRLHDRGSSNGTFVNGQKVSDYHLNEGCTIGFGTVEAQFSPEDVATAEEAETFPSRGEVNAVRQENAEMRATVSALREEIAALRQEHKASAESGATVSREEYDQVVVERESLKEIQLRQEEEINRFKTDLAILKRDRLNLQLAYDGAQREMEQLRRKLSGEEEAPALPPVEAAAVVAAQADEVRIELPKFPTVIMPAIVRDEAPAGAPAPMEAEEVAMPDGPAVTEVPEPMAPAASLPFKPLSKPMLPLAKAPGAPSAPAVSGQPPKQSAPGGLPQKPVTLPPKGSALPPGAIIKPPGAKPTGAINSNGVRPLPPPAGVPAPAMTPRAGQRPLPAARPLPTVKLVPAPAPAPKVGPKGTQKIAE